MELLRLVRKLSSGRLVTKSHTNRIDENTFEWFDASRKTKQLDAVHAAQSRSISETINLGITRGVRETGVPPDQNIVGIQALFVGRSILLGRVCGL